MIRHYVARLDSCLLPLRCRFTMRHYFELAAFFDADAFFFQLSFRGIF